MAKGTLTAEFELPQRVNEENVAASRVPLRGALPKRSGSLNLDVHEVERGRRARDVGGAFDNMGRFSAGFTFPYVIDRTQDVARSLV